MLTPEYKIVLGVVATVIGFVGYVPYVRDVVRQTTRPHLFSWFGWFVLEVIAFFAMIAKGAGPGAWAIGMSALVVFFIVCAALKNSDKQIVGADWFALTGALIGIVLWQTTHNPMLAIISVTIADMFAFAPTFRKAYYKPHEETATEFALSSVKFMFALAALNSFNLTTVLYPASLIITNAAFTIMVLRRRKTTRL